MDLLADLLVNAGLQRRLLHERQLANGDALVFPCDKSFGFHVVIRGTAYLHTTQSATPLTLNTGDVAFMARGCRHVVATSEALPDTLKSVGDEMKDAPRPVVAPPAAVTLVSGAYQFWNTPVHPFFSELPDWHVIRAAALTRFEATDLAIQLLADESRHDAMGHETVTQALLDILFTHLLRRLLDTMPEDRRGWSQGLRDMHVRRALEALHAQPEAEWTLDEIARRAGLSRSGLAQKFRQTVGTSPLQYLTTLRMQSAMRMLAESDTKLETVAQAVGYQDAFSFSKVFKKVVGVSPKAFRTRDRAERQAPYRLG